jgi:uracil phosphoribosyltransferase
MTDVFPTVTVIAHPLARHALSVLRDRRTDTALFRQAARRLGLLLACEVTRDLPLGEVPIETPLEPMMAPCLAGPPPCIVSILRGGNAIQQGMLELLPHAVAGQIGLTRNEATLTPEEYYLKLPADIEERLTIVVDPMIATGGSATLAVDRLRAMGAGEIRFACLLAAPEGLRRFTAAHPDVPVFAVSIDHGLNERGFILPGLGDAGDRFHGT